MGKKSSRKKVSGKDKAAGSGKVPASVKTQPAASRDVTPEEKEKLRIEGIKKTVIPGVLGIIAGIVLFVLLGDGVAQRGLWFSVLFIVLALAYYVQRIIYPLIRVNVREFGKKDWFYVEFIVLDFCLVTWTILLNI